MAVEDTIDVRLDRHVTTLGEVLSIKPRLVTEGREQARRIIDQGLVSAEATVIVGTRRLQQYPLRHGYGEAVNALLCTIVHSRQAKNLLGNSIFGMLEDHARREQRFEGNRSPGMFVFYALQQVEKVSTPLWQIEIDHLSGTFPLATWGYLCHSIVAPEDFKNKKLVAVTDRVGKNPEERGFAPSITVIRGRITLDGVWANNPGSPCHYMTVRELFV